MKVGFLDFFTSAALVLLAAGSAVAQTNGCSSLMEANYPKAPISNGPVQAVSTS